MEIAAAAQHLVSEPSFARAARAVHAELDDRPGPSDVLSVLEALV